MLTRYLTGRPSGGARSRAQAPLLFFTAVDRGYEIFACPYAFTALFHNPDAICEIAVESPERFRAENAASLEVIERAFPERFTLKRGNFSGLAPNTVRFREMPTRRARNVYIGDADILILEDIGPRHEANMRVLDLPYSNIVRPGKKRLSGLHFSRWEAFYPQCEVDASPHRDEAYLYALVEERGLPLPPREADYRPLHGFHFSLNRRPRADTWSLSEAWIPHYLALRADPRWQALLHTLDRSYRVLIALADAILATKGEEDLDPLPGTRLGDL